MKNYNNNRKDTKRVSHNEKTSYKHPQKNKASKKANPQPADTKANGEFSARFFTNRNPQVHKMDDQKHYAAAKKQKASKQQNVSKSSSDSLTASSIGDLINKLKGLSAETLLKMVNEEAQSILDNLEIANSHSAPEGEVPANLLSETAEENEENGNALQSLTDEMSRACVFI